MPKVIAPGAHAARPSRHHREPRLAATGRCPLAHRPASLRRWCVLRRTLSTRRLVRWRPLEATIRPRRVSSCPSFPRTCLTRSSSGTFAGLWASRRPGRARIATASSSALSSSNKSTTQCGAETRWVAPLPFPASTGTSTFRTTQRADRRIRRPSAHATSPDRPSRVTTPSDQAMAHPAGALAARRSPRRSPRRSALDGALAHGRAATARCVWQDAATPQLSARGRSLRRASSAAALTAPSSGPVRRRRLRSSSSRAVPDDAAARGSAAL